MNVSDLIETDLEKERQYILDACERIRNHPLKVPEKPECVTCIVTNCSCGGCKE